MQKDHIYHTKQYLAFYKIAITKKIFLDFFDGKNFSLSVLIKLFYKKIS